MKNQLKNICEICRFDIEQSLGKHVIEVVSDNRLHIVAETDVLKSTIPTSSREWGWWCIECQLNSRAKSYLGYKYLGEHSVKNIAEPVRVYRVLIDPEAASKIIGEKRYE